MGIGVVRVRGLVLAVVGLFVVVVAVPGRGIAGGERSAEQVPGLVSVDPVRLVETRSGSGNLTVDGLFEGGGRLRAGETLAFPVAGRAGVPLDVTGVVLNVTAVAPSGPGFLTVFPCGEDRPVTSNSNYVAGDVVASLVMAKVGAGGQVCVYSHAGTDLVVDLNGIIAPNEGVYPRTPFRMLDTRTDELANTLVTYRIGNGGRWRPLEGPLPAGATLKYYWYDHRSFSVGPDLLLTVTAVLPDAPGYLTVYTCEQRKPHASNLNYTTGDVVANSVLVSIGYEGQVCMYSSADTDLVVDLSGTTGNP